MKRLSVGSAALLVVLSTPALAVDMTPVFKTLPNDSATRDWAGVYGRGNGVANDGTLHGVPFSSGALNSNPDNFKLGVVYQKGPVAVGVEAEMRRWQGPNLDFTPGALESPGLWQSWLGTIGPRAGVVVGDSVIYGKGGVVYSVKANETGLAQPSPGAEVRTGWSAGAGWEFAGGTRWSLGLEYLYADFGKKNANQTSQGSLPMPSGTSPDQSHQLRGKFNYNFDWNAPLKIDWNAPLKK